MQASVVEVPGLSCPAAHGIFPDQALAGGFLTTGPLGKSHSWPFKYVSRSQHCVNAAPSVEAVALDPLHQI